MTKCLDFAVKIKGEWWGGWQMRSPPTLPPPKKNLERANGCMSRGDFQ